MRKTPAELFLGIDLGTSGVRVLAATAAGDVAARAAVPLPPEPQPSDARHEQDPESWWAAVCEACRRVMEALAARRMPAGSVRALAVDGTSGTLVCVDARGTPLRPALMYNDGRAAEEAEALNEAAAAFCDKMGYRFSASYALPKVLWIRRHEPEVFARTHRLLHQADVAVGWLTGRFDVSDYSNALKTGYDLLEEGWPDWIGRWDGVRERLPEVVPPGTRVGAVTRQAAGATGLPAGLAVVSGATDGIAGCLASGLHRPGDYHTSLGTTLVFKGISDRRCTDPEGRIYCHKLPQGVWLPGAASNTGAEWIRTLFPGIDPAVWDAQAAALLPTKDLAYPLVRRGERFPFLCPTAEGFPAHAGSGVEAYAARLQGTAFIERLGYDVLDGITGGRHGDVYSTGGGSRSDVWMQCRADACGRLLHRPACPEAAMGAAMLAASGTTLGDLDRTVRAMTRIEATFEPRPDRVAACEEAYHRFLEALKERAYL